MEQAPQVFNFTWQGVEVRVTFTPRFRGFMEHLAIESIAPKRAPLPVTGTGYLSHFMQPGTIAAHGGDVVAQVKAWLDDESRSLEWRESVEASRQGELF